MNYQDLSKNDLNTILCEACYKGNLDLIKEVFRITQAKKCNNTIAKNMVLIAAEKGHHDIIKYMVESEELNNIITNKFKRYIFKDAFKEACSKGKLDIVDYLFNLTDLKINDKPQAIEEGFHKACSSGHLPIIHYLLKHSDLNIQNNFSTFEYGSILAVRGGHNHLLKYFFESNPEFFLKLLKNSTILHTAESNKQIDVIKYLLTSSDFKDKIHIHDDNDIIYKCAHNGNMLNILKYLIIDFNINKTEDIKNHLKVFPNEEVEKMFNFHDLVNNLEVNHIKTRKVKI